MFFRTVIPVSLIISLILILNQEVHAQLSVTSGSVIGMTPTEFVQTYLVGTGVVVTNATYNGSPDPLNSTSRPAPTRDQIGSFSTTGGATTELGIAGGVLLSTGKVQNAITGGVQSFGTGGGSDPDLVILASTGGPMVIHDKSVLEFDFVPETDVVTFRYVFASNEFDEYCNSYNDAFGLFLSGPGIAGGLGFVNNAVNIAILPDGSNYVNIFNICASDNGNHGFGKYSWWNGDKKNYSLDRLTYVFSANYSVQCGETYHMKFAIGDALDGSLDSDVFLEQNSFSSNNITPNTSCSNPGVGTLLIPGCSTTDLSYSIPQAKTTSLTIELAIHPSGTATQADVLPNPFPTQITIPAGQTQSPIITIVAIPSALPQPDKVLVIKATVIACSVANTATSSITIKYNAPLSVSAPPVTLCSGGAASLTTTVSGGQPFIPSNVYHYLWNTGSASPTISINPPPGHTTYTVTVTDACYQTTTITTYADVGTTPGAAGTISGLSAICTPNSGVNYSVPVIPGADEYLWTLPPGASIIAGNFTNSVTVSFTTATTSGNITVKGHSVFCGDGPSASLALNIHPAPEPAGPITGSTALCQGPSAVTYSIAPLLFTTSYEWTVPPGVTIVSSSNTNQIICLVTTSATSGNFTVRGYNADCGYGTLSTLYVTINPVPGNAGTIVSNGGSSVCQRQNGVQYEVPVIANTSDYLWTYTGSGVTMTINGPILLLDFSAAATSGILSVKGQNSCGEGLSSPLFPITVKPKPTVAFAVCNSIKTTKNGRPILLKGGRPLGSGGVYSGTGVTMVSPGIYVFDPANSNITGGGAANGINHQVEYRFTNIQGCYDDKNITIAVYGSNASDPCPGIVKDQRDGKNYPTFMAGTGASARCWMAANLDYGSYTNHKIVQTDNCTIEKYCNGNVESQCTTSGGYYQWGEIMEYQENTGYQDICPPGFHIPSAAEWDQLIAFYNGNGIAGSSLKDPMSADGFHGMLEGIYYLNSFWAYSTGTNTGTMFWTADGQTGGRALARGLNFINLSVSSYPASRGNAFPVRCVRN